MNKVHIKTNTFTSKKVLLILWCKYFLFALFAGFVFYHFLIPNIPSLHAPGSSFTPDSAYFNDVAIKLVNDIREHGWSAWKLYPSIGAAGQSSFLAIVYFYFGINPLFAIAFNALFHSFSAILIYLIAIELLKGSRFAGTVALVSSLCYLSFPSELFLVGQIHKDLFVAFGFLLVLWSILKMFLHQDNNVGLLKLFITLIAALLVVASMKLYLLQVLAFTVLLIILLQVVRIFPFSIIKFSFLVAYLAFILSAFFYLNNEDPLPNVNPNPKLAWLSGEVDIPPLFS